MRRSRRRRQSPTRWRPDSPPARWRPATPPRYWRYRSPPGDPRPHARSWGHDRRGVQGVMERAPPLPHRRIYPHSPNQPVPPPRALRRNGFGTGTHADSARGPDLPEDGHEVKRLPADPALGLLIRKCYAVIKAVHHLRQVSPGAGGPGPRTIARTVDTLSTMIKPAAPTPATRLLTEGAAREWGHNVCIILKQHYEDCVGGLLEEMANTGLLAQDWGEAFLVALRWAHRNLPRITDAAIEDAEARLFAAAGRERDPTPTPVPEVLPPRFIPPPEVLPQRSCPPPPASMPPRENPPPPGAAPLAAPPGVLPRRPSRPPAPLSPPRRTSPPATTPPASPPPVRTLRSRPPPSPPASPPPASPPPVRTPRSRRPPPSPPATPPPESPPPVLTLRPRRPPPVAVGRATLPAVVPPNVKECSLRCPVCEGYRDHWVSKVRIKETNKIEFKMACLDCGKHYRTTQNPARIQA